MLTETRERLESMGVSQRVLDTAFGETLDGLATGPRCEHDAIPDTPGTDLCPDPGAARTEAEFLDCLRNYRTWAGNPSYRVMARRCEHRFAASTICTALRGEVVPSLDMVLTIVSACGGPERHRREFASAWRRLALPDQALPEQAKPDPALPRQTRPYDYAADYAVAAAAARPAVRPENRQPPRNVPSRDR
ncbi:MAG: hypothetical protein J2P25_00295 [Nocardiopsaceae bacterium]|nr:hypothetical protein [Nocardiopsaceae bacterium]